MIILGIDPGFAHVGYAVIEQHGSSVRVLDAETIKTTAQALHPDRLKTIHNELLGIIQKWKPSVASIERLFFTANQKTAIPVAEARGVILLTVALHGLTVYEYTPLQVKLAITGSGTADKKAVKKMVFLMIEVPNRGIQDDAVDAIALAVTAAYDKNKMNSL